jgi:hypothetical protein
MTMWSNRRTIGVIACAVGGTLTLSACTPTGPISGHHRHGHGTGHQRGRAAAIGCLGAIHGVMYGPGRLLPTWLPAGFRRSAVTQAGLAMPTENYTLSRGQPNSPRIEVGFANDPRPFAWFSGGQAAREYPTIQGHRGRLEAGPAAARLISVYWKPDRVHLLKVTGYRVSAAVVVTVAKNLWFDPPGLVPLPLTAGHIVSKRAAIAMALRVSDIVAGRSIAKLSSWAEVAALLEAGHAAGVLASVPGAFASERWQPVWTVLVTDTATGVAALVLINAATGQPVVTTSADGHPAWFAALTDRSQTLARRCQGGSLLRLPFGILTRDEEAFVVAATQPAFSHASATVRLKLTTVPAMNRADSGIYGGCVQQSCSINELVWVIITTVRANRGSTVTCLPGFASYPPGYRPSHVKRYFSVSVPGNDGIYCRNLPDSIVRLRDLSPPLGRG